MGDGDDVVHRRCAARDLAIRTGAGADRVVIGANPDTAEADPAADVAVKIRGSLTIRPGLTTTSFASRRRRSAKRLTVFTDGGADRVVLGDEAAVDPPAGTSAASRPPTRPATPRSTPTCCALAAGCRSPWAKVMIRSRWSTSGHAAAQSNHVSPKSTQSKG